MGSANFRTRLEKIDFYHVVQPVMDLTNDRIQGYEVLLRSETFQNPELFFRQAMEQDRLFELDMLSVSKAIQMIERIKSDSVFYINVFPSTLVNPNFLSEMEKVIENTNLSSGSIVFEISEAEETTDMALLKKIIGKLKEQDFFIALDDFGKGESTLKSILELEPDVVKVDRYFANEIAQLSKKQQVISHMLQFLGEDANMVLEGLEYEEDVHMAKELGVQYGQGFVLGKPEPLRFYLDQEFPG